MWSKNWKGDYLEKLVQTSETRLSRKAFVFKPTKAGHARKTNHHPGYIYKHLYLLLSLSFRNQCYFHSLVLCFFGLFVAYKVMKSKGQAQSGERNSWLNWGFEFYIPL